MKNVLIIGAGQVGAHVAQCGISKNLPVHFYLHDTDKMLTDAQTLDLKDTLLFSKNSKVSNVNIEDLPVSDMDVVIITAGANQKPGETRIDLLAKNKKILESIADQLKGLKPSAIIILVTNPVDITTKIAQDVFDLPTSQVIGSGTLLDSARLRWRIADHLNINISNVHGYVLAEHGDSEFVAWSTLNSSVVLSDEEKQSIESDVRKQAYEIIQGKGATYFGIGAASIHILNAILNDTREIMPVSVNYPHFSDENLRNTPIGMPAVIGASGIISIPETRLNEKEKQLLETSANRLLEIYSEAN